MFRHPDDVVEEAKKQTIVSRLLVTFVMGFIALFGFIITLAIGKGTVQFLLVMIAIAGGCIYLLELIEKKKLKEAEELRKACFE